MARPYTIRVFVPDGDPDGVKVVNLLNWTGVGVAFPRSAWPKVSARPEFGQAGVYILTGFDEGMEDELPTVYVGQGDEIRTRIDSHYVNKDFWDWGYGFVSSSNALNRAHITWLEYALLRKAREAERCHFDNSVNPKEPRLSESEHADTEGFLREMLRILPLLGVGVFERPVPVAVPAVGTHQEDKPRPSADLRDTIVVPAQEEGFQEVFLGEDCWYAIRIGGGMLSKIKHIAAYQTSPVSAVTHYADVARIEPYGDRGKYRVVFSGPAKPLDKPVPYGDAPKGSMQGPRYTSLDRLLSATKISDLLVLSGHSQINEQT